jgi:protein transport protein SEC20
MGTSKQLIVALERSDWLDRMLILSGIMFFSVIVLFILKQVRVVPL